MGVQVLGLLSKTASVGVVIMVLSTIVGNAEFIVVTEYM